MRSRTPRKPAEKRSFLFCPDAPVTLRYRGATGGTGRDDTYADFVSVCAVVCMESFQHCGGVHRPHREPPGDVTLPLAATVGDLRLVNSGSEAPLVSRLRVSVELQRSLPQRRETITVSTVKVKQTNLTQLDQPDGRRVSEGLQLNQTTEPNILRGFLVC
ncbi:Hypothetical protein SMAX5B_009172 [Scophthalmus maximus]|uniref:Uncharacterized protein n=1 Tax=Scophthalmus maximus TaxID=52904 RepID=A0A2U9C4X7_SCOMX|nr:Hypothetical protein SMAX5B_009172 [Scophthalmus maximus]